MMLVEDLKGDVEELGLYNFRPALDRDGSWIAPGTILAIKEPYLKYGMMNVLFIRVDSPSDVLFIHETDEKSLWEVGAIKWYYHIYILKFLTASLKNFHYMRYIFAGTYVLT